ncbi:MAG: hypothetical protein KJ874_13400, partial [Acidobacteria bacterium]|nr:hypothetical protein [Acidobacteriota bacterium]
MKVRIVSLAENMITLKKFISFEGATVVEIGPGWDPICSVLLYLMGVKTCYAYDHVKHVRFNIVKMLIRSIKDKLHEIAQITSIPLNILEKRLSKLKGIKSLDDFFSRANIVYYAPGDASKTDL